MIEDEQEEEYLALEALEALQRLQSNEARSRHVSATKRLQITNELDKSGNYYSHASELFGNKAVKEYWDVNASTASGTDSRSVRVSMLEKSLRSVVRRTPGADWPKRKRPRPGQSEPSDVISIGTFFLNQVRDASCRPNQSDCFPAVSQWHKGRQGLPHRLRHLDNQALRLLR